MGAILGNDSDPEGDKLFLRTYDLVTSQGGSNDTGHGGGFNYTPPPGFIGNDSFTYTIADGAYNNAETDTAVVTVTVTAGNEPIFADVPLNYWAVDEIETLYRNGITNGCALNPLRYCPSDPVTRAQMAAFLIRTVYGGDFVPPAPTGVFADVPVTDPFAPVIEQLFRDGITRGCGKNPPIYCPADIVTRAQMAAFVVRTLYGPNFIPPAPVGIFADVPVTDPFAPVIEQLFRDGITVGCGTNPLIYCPTDTVTRDQMAVFLVRAFNLP